MRNSAKCTIVVVSLLLAVPLIADPVPVRRVQGSIHGYIVLKNIDDKVLASGDVTQLPAGNRVSTILTLNFKDGSFYQEHAVFSQRRIFQLISYKQVQRGPSFKTPQTLSFDASSGNVSTMYVDKNGAEKQSDKHLRLPTDLANGIIPMLMSEIDPKVETTLSMVVSTPEPRVVKLKISAIGTEPFSIAGTAAAATHYLIKIDIGGVAGVVAKAVGKQPPPTNMWAAVGNVPVFLKSEGPLFEDGPIWRIELASPSWPKGSEK